MAKEVKKAATKESAPKKAAAKEPAKKVAAKEPEKKVATKEPAKKAAVKEVAPAETTAKGVVGKYRVDCVYGDLYQFYLYANNGQLLYESREYASKKSCLEGIETFKKNMQDAATTVRVDKDKNNRYKFIIKNRNSIYVGETYDNKKQAESSAESVKRFAVVSQVVE
ncbi:putative uncharacterized protein [Clostridium sp. CAG:349]|jgi:uncharacterized protein YegP (UPF0339 family)|nr:putative uncharacterized protein [Clostridium sp. CAG:349]